MAAEQPEKPALPLSAPPAGGRPVGSVLDIVVGARAKEAGASPHALRGVLMVYFTCANQYQRVFRSADGKQYLARCATCGKSMRFLVGEGGSDERLFRVSCRA
jgi:hypothetical protein